MKKIIEFFRNIHYKIKQHYKIKRRLKEMKKKDPFIYD